MNDSVGTIARSLVTAVLSVFLLSAVSYGQPSDEPEGATEETVPEVTQNVEVEPLAEDSDIATRLTRILEATEWFVAPEVEVDEGVVFLRGKVDSEPHREWAGNLAGKTQDVVAVVNRIEIIEKSIWDMSPAWNEIKELGKQSVRNAPLFAVGILLMAATWMATRWAVKAARSIFSSQFKSQLLRDVAARAIAIPVFLMGLYLILKVSGLTQLAMTVIGGTGLIGLVIGFAFRDIAENFLASILISIQHPFARGDRIRVAEYEGFVQSVNTRSTLLMTLEGNHVQIPNSKIYKETITNYTANPNARLGFTIGIGYEDSIAQAQSIALEVLREHPAVVDDPESLVLVDALGAATVNLRVYFWANTTEFSDIKVRSAVIRQIKSAFEEQGISMPDEAREVVFPSGVPVRMLSDESEQQAVAKQSRSDSSRSETTVHSAEGDLKSESHEISKQAQKARSPEAGEDLLKG